jgi:hypothetical protein
MIYELKIDIDGKFNKREFNKRLDVIRRFLKFQRYDIDKSKTRHGYHIMLTFGCERKLEDKDIVFFQLMLGSDPNREMFNWLRVVSGCKRWNVLFKEKYNADGKRISHEKSQEWT